MIRKRNCWLCFALALCCTSASAQSKPETSTPSYEQGSRLLGEYRDREALEVFRLAGHHGDPRALRMTGLMYLWGNVLYPGVPNRPELALRWLRSAAQQGDPVARQWLLRDSGHLLESEQHR